MLYYFVLNGPPKSGKSTAAREAIRWFTFRGIKAHSEGFANPIKQFVASLLGLPYSSIDKSSDYELFPCSVRQVLIDLSEKHLKAQYGQDIFGRALANRWSKTALAPTPNVLIIDDGGFEEEYHAIGCERTCLVRVLRPNYNFDGDSRGYIRKPDRLLINNTDIHELYLKVDELVDDAIVRWKLKPSIYTEEKKVLAEDEES